MVARFQVFSTLADISGPFKGVLLDAYGVFWGGNSFGLFPGSKEAMAVLVASGKSVGILSNSTQLAAKEVEKLQKHGLIEGVHFHFFITSGEVARRMFYHEKLPFKTPRKRFWLFGGIHPKFSSHQALFKDSSYVETGDIAEADFIYISIPHINGEDQLDPAIFQEDVKRLKGSNIPMLCVNPDRFAHEGSPPRAVVRQGSIAALYEEMGGSVFYIGKPSSLAFAAAMEQFSKHKIIDPREILMVGDTPETDIRGARQFGMPSALITQTGIMAERIEDLESSIKHLLPAEHPDFLIGHL